jgi:hypothetical protein
MTQSPSKKKGRQFNNPHPKKPPKAHPWRRTQRKEPNETK